MVKVVRYIGWFFLIFGVGNAWAQQGRDVYYTALPNYYYLEWSQKVETPNGTEYTLVGFSKSIADTLFKKVFSSRRITGKHFSNTFEAVSAAKIGKWVLGSDKEKKIGEGDNIDIIVGIPYDADLAKYFYYIKPPIDEDNLVIAMSDKYPNFVFSGRKSLRLLDQKNWFASVVRGFSLGSKFGTLMEDLYYYNGASCSELRLKEQDENKKVGVCFGGPKALKRVEANLDEIMGHIIKGDKGFYYLGSMFLLFDYLNQNKFTKVDKIFKNAQGEGIYSQVVKIDDNKESLPLYIAISKKSDLIVDAKDPQLNLLETELKNMIDSGQLQELRNQAKNNWQNK
jgi:hypothetical protein